MKMEEYLNVLTQQIRCQRAREPVKRELEAHIEEQTEAFICEGMEEEKARLEAVREMGDPVAVGGALDRIHRPRMAWRLLGAAAILGVIGMLVQYILTGRMSRLQPSSDIAYKKQFFYLAVSIAVMTGVCRLDYSRIGRYAKGIYLTLFCFLLLGIVFAASSINGTVRWIGFPFGITVNVTMLLLLFVPLYAAILYAHRGQGYAGMAGTAVRWMVLPVFLAWMCRSIYTMCVLTLAFLAVFIVAVCSGWYRVSKRLVVAVTFAAAALLAAGSVWYILTWAPGYQAARLQVFLTNSENYQMMVLRRVLRGSRWIGSAGEEILAQLGTVPAADYTLACVIAVFGLAAGILLMTALLLFILRFFYLAWRQKNQMGRLMGIGCCVVLAAEWVFYAAENLGLGMPMGSYCPFLTYGGSGMVVTYTLFGLMLSIYRYENTFPEAGLMPEEEARRGGKRSIMVSVPVIVLIILAFLELW